MGKVEHQVWHKQISKYYFSHLKQKGWIFCSAHWFLSAAKRMLTALIMNAFLICSFIISELFYFSNTLCEPATRTSVTTAFIWPCLWFIPVSFLFIPSLLTVISPKSSIDESNTHPLKRAKCVACCMCNKHSIKIVLWPY